MAALDLSATELCGGTVSLQRTFGELRGSAVRISDDGRTALLGSDGLCSVGPMLERDSGCYHVELLVRQATDSDGAYVGLITPQAKTSSYPGADAHGIGWRAKGGVRHKHNSIFEASALAWGKDDRWTESSSFPSDELRMFFLSRLHASCPLPKPPIAFSCPPAPVSCLLLTPSIITSTPRVGLIMLPHTLCGHSFP